MKNYLIVGADRGIGREMVRQLSERGEYVLGACLAGDTLEGQNVVTIPYLDVTSDSAAEKLAKALVGAIFIPLHCNLSLLLQKNKLNNCSLVP